jgi:hypothetical protein
MSKATESVQLPQMKNEKPLSNNIHTGNHRNNCSTKDIRLDRQRAITKRNSTDFIGCIGCENEGNYIQYEF